MKLMQREPRLLHANVETILKPRMRSLQDMGFSDTEIVQLVSSCPNMLNLRDIQLRINFWRSLLGSNERLIKACRSNMFLFASSLARKIEPNISLLRECGISEQHIAQMVVRLPSFLSHTEKCIKEAIKHVEELGVSRDCNMFPHALSTVMTLSRSRFDATFATLMSFGWSQADSLAVFRRHPVIWNYSKKNLCDKMTFLMKEAGCELTYIIYRPVLLTYSLEKRLRPRYEVINFLDQNKLLDKGHSLLSVVMLSEEKFRNKFLFLLRKEKFIAQYDSYVVAVRAKHYKLVWGKVNYFRRVTKISSFCVLFLPYLANSAKRHPQSRTRALNAAVKLSPPLQRPRLRRFPRRTVHAAASSPSANGDSARYLSLTTPPPPLPPSPLFCILPFNKSTIHVSSYELFSLLSFSTAKDQISDHKSYFTVANPLQSCELSSETAAKTAKFLTSPCISLLHILLLLFLLRRRKIPSPASSTPLFALSIHLPFPFPTP
ncbi:unnamed protein product [Musa acuminata var. zebrina]